MFENNMRTEISSLGEFGLINHLAESIKTKHAGTLKGIGDDAAVLDNGNGQVNLLSTDMLVEGVHFDLAYTPLKHLGYKAVVVNLSDIYAMNGVPKYITVSISFSNRFSIEAIEELYMGINMACESYNIDLVGGDTASSRSGLIISISVLGDAKKEDVVYRKGAKEHNLVCVSGDLGGAYVGLQLLEREKRIFIENPGVQPDLAGRDYVIERQLKPEARREIIKLFKEKDILPTSMIDISDGLSSELHHIANQSGVGITIYEDKLPIDPVTFNTAVDLGLETTMCALNGGEDYELLFTIKQADFEKVSSNPEIHIIGHCTDSASGLQLVSKTGIQHKLAAQGWVHS